MPLYLLEEAEVSLEEVSLEEADDRHHVNHAGNKYPCQRGNVRAYGEMTIRL